MDTLTRSDLLLPFTSPGKAETAQIGIEVELGTVDPETGHSISYENKDGVRTLIESLLETGGEPVFDCEHLMGLRRENGSQLTLEAGGALEYSSAPATSLVALIEAMDCELALAADVARTHHIALLLGGNFPFNTSESATWVPKQRLSIMRRYFRDQGDAGSLADNAMALTLSTQVTLDYHSESDFSNKVRVQLAASPVVAALFANSPIEAGRYSGALSRRTQYYFKLDPNRCGYPTFALKNEITFDDVIDCLLQLPMVYRYKNGRYEAPPKRPFAELIDQGFGDGTTPSLLDWTSQLSQVWPYVRVRNTVELRVADGPTYPNIPALPAFWVGLTYHHPSCEAAWDVLQGHTFAEHHQAMYDVTVNGLSARLGNDPIQELAIELVRLAKQGLSARIEAGLESPRALAYLDPIDEVAMSGTTFAQTCLQRWENELHYQPARYVDAYRL